MILIKYPNFNWIHISFSLATRNLVIADPNSINKRRLLQMYLVKDYYYYLFIPRSSL